MKFGQIIFSISIGVLIFAAILVTENARFEFKNNIKNPFDIAESIDSFSENKKNTHIDLLTIDGEFFRFYPQSLAIFNNKNRELVDGEFFISSQFINDKALLVAQTNFINPFISSKFKPTLSQFKIGDIFISIPNSSVFIKRDKEKERIKIYAIDHSIEIFLKNATVPFVLPAGMSIDIRESILSNNTGKLYYTKLKKELGLNQSNLNLNISATKNSIKVQDKVISALIAKNKIHKSMKLYAENVPYIWLWFENQGFIGGLTTFIQNSQIKFSIGYPKEKAKKFRINKILKPFVMANRAVSVGDIENAKLFLTEFKSSFGTKDWFTLLLESSFNDDWDLFTHVQKSWIRNILPDDPAIVFVEFWDVNKNTNSFSFIESKFNLIELLIPKKEYSNVIKGLSDINNTIKSIKITKNDLNSITKLRRILFELIKEKEAFQKKEIFELYGFFIRKEIEFYKNEEKDEIQLESAQNILFFLKIFIENDSKEDISNLLLKIYNVLEVDKITEKRNRTRIFSEEELDLIETIKILGNGGLTEETKKAFNRQQQIINERRKKDKERLKKIEKNDIIINKNIINTKELFINYLENLKINIEKIVITTNKETYKFSNVVYKNLKISGTFNTKTQQFIYLKVGNKIERNEKKSDLKVLLEYMVKNQTKSSTKKPTIKKVPQNTNRAITDRDAVRGWFNSLDIVFSLKDIEALDFNYNKFKIKNAIYNKQVKLSFNYTSDSTDVIEKLIIQTGRSPLEIPYKIKRENLTNEIDKIILEIQIKRESS